MMQKIAKDLQPVDILACNSANKDGLLTELQAPMSRKCRFLLFFHHNYQVFLRKAMLS